jgi:hypothetical protein
MTEFSLLGWLTLVVLFLTGAVVTLYTVETYRLRRESQLQTELQNRPFLSLVAQRSEPSVHVINIGKGLARNIGISEITIGSSFLITAPPITHIAPGEPELPDWRVKVSVTGDDPLTEPPFSRDPDRRETAARILTTNAVTVILTYASIVGQEYETTIVLDEGIARITDDRRKRGRPDGPAR